MPQVFKLAIEENGDATMIYSDDTVDLMEEIGKPAIERASYVEPNPHGAGWLVSIPGWCKETHTEGIVFGPFRLRSEALQREVTWLEGKYF